MGLSAGWYRLWAATGISLLLLATYLAMQTRDAMPDFDGKPCVIGSEETVTDYDLIRDATSSEVVEEVKRVQQTRGVEILGPQDILQIARRNADRNIQKAAEYTECVSISRLFDHIIIAIASILSIIAVSLVCRWIFLGFKRQNT